MPCVPRAVHAVGAGYSKIARRSSSDGAGVAIILIIIAVVFVVGVAIAWRCISRKAKRSHAEAYKKSKGRLAYRKPRNPGGDDPMIENGVPDDWRGDRGNEMDIANWSKPTCGSRTYVSRPELSYTRPTHTRSSHSHRFGVPVRPQEPIRPTDPGQLMQHSRGPFNPSAASSLPQAPLPSYPQSGQRTNPRSKVSRAHSQARSLGKHSHSHHSPSSRHHSSSRNGSTARSKTGSYRNGALAPKS